MKYLTLVTLLLAVFVFSGCFPGDANPYERAGFFSGVWHGLICVFTLIASFFTDVGIYEVNNNGRWYEFGFIVGVFLVFVLVCFGRST